MDDSKITEEIEKLAQAQVHLGHRKNRLHPQAKKFIYKMIDGVAVIDLTKTITQLHLAKEYLQTLAKSEKVVLVVATKRTASQFVKDLAEKHSVPFISSKWPPGLITNFDTIMKNVKKLLQLEEDKKSGAWTNFVKHEVVKFEKEIIKLKRLYGGIVSLTKKPDALLIVDIKKEKNALIEARAYKIPLIAVMDTNSNPALVDFPIMANDDSSSSVEYLMKDLIDAYVSGRQKEQKVK